MEADQEIKPNGGKFRKLHENLDQNIKILWEKEQEYIRQRVIEKNEFEWDLQSLDLIGGVDISAHKDDPDIACSALIIYSRKNKAIVFEATQIVKINQPYIPGFLAFREVPSLLELFRRLKQQKPHLWPQLLFVDGNGILHQNKCGLACHLGVLVDVPTIGVGKTLFYIDGLGKESVKEMCESQIKKQGDFCLLRGDSGRIWGAGLRNTKNAVNPIFVSIGHKIELDIAIKSVILLSEYRVVEPVRLADKRSRQLIEKFDLNLKDNLPLFQMVYLSS